MKYTDWLPWRGKGSRGKYEHIARKMLGALRGRMTLGDLKIGSDKLLLEDGALVEVMWNNGQPLARVTPPGVSVTDACEMYVESGLLDLGANIAADASDRFNRGRPEFDDEPAQLYFGTSMNCTAFGGLNGRVNIGLRDGDVGIVGGCLNQDETGPIASRLSGPIKKQAQALCPPSLWTGYMAQYVAAIYGGNTIQYRANDTDFCLELTTIDPENPEDPPTAYATLSPWFALGSWGLLDIGGAFRFVEILSDGTVNVYAAGFGTCAIYVLKFWRKIKDGPPDKAAKVLSIALSDCKPRMDAPIATFSITMERDRTFSTYGWAFSKAAAKATLVVDDEENAVHHEITFSIDEETGEMVMDDVVLETEEKPGANYAGNIISPKTDEDDAEHEVFFKPSSNDTLISTTYDIAVRAWYEGEDMVVVRYKAAVGTPSGTVTAALCGEEYLYYTDADHTGSYYASIPFPVVDCVCRGDNDCVITSTGNGSRFVQVSSGYYCLVGGLPSWSRVVLRDTSVSLVNDSIYRKAEGNLRAIAPCDPDLLIEYACVHDFDLEEFYTPEAEAEVMSNSVAGCVILNGPDAPTECTQYTYDVTDGPSFPLDCCPDDNGQSFSRHYVITYNGTACLREYIRVTGFINTLPLECLIMPFGASTLPIGLEYGVDGPVSARQYRGNFGTQLTTSVTRTLTSSIQCPIDEDHPTEWMCAEADEVYSVTESDSITSPCFSQNVDGLGNEIQIGGLSFNDTPEAWEGSGSFVGYEGTITPCAWENDTTSTEIEPTFGTYGVETFASTVYAPAGDIDVNESADVLYVEDDSPLPAFDTYDFSGASCGVTHASTLTPPAADAGASVDVKEGGTRPLADEYANYLRSSNEFLCDGFIYRALRSQLDDAVTPAVDTVFGASVNMDREAISGGYPTVSSPSFIGWA